MSAVGFIGVGTCHNHRSTAGGNPPAEFSVSLEGLMQGAAQDGTVVTYSITGAVAQTQRWQLSPQGGIWTDIPGATAVSETIDLMGGQYTDGAFIRVGVTANGQERFSSSVQLRYAPPGLGQVLEDQSFTEATGVIFYDASTGFTGDGLTYAISPLVGVSITAETGLIGFDTDQMARQIGTTVTVSATNSGGDVTADFLITLLEPGSFALESIAGEPVIMTENGALSVTIELGPYAGTYAQRVTDSAALTVEMVEAAVTPLVLPVATGGTAAGDTLTATTGLWLYAGVDPGDQTHQWYRDGAAILGATGASYTLAAADLGADVTVRETFDGVTIESPAVSIPASNFAPSDLPSLADDFDATVGVVEDAGGVTSWTSQDPEATVLAPTAAGNRPTTGLETQNNLNVFSMDGGDSLVRNTAPFSPSGTVFVVSRVTAVDDAFDSVYAMDNASTDFQIDSGLITDNEYHGRVNSTVHTNLERSTPLTDWFVLAYRWDSSNNTVSLWVNGVKDDEQADYTTHYASTASRVVAFSNRGVSQEPQGNLAQIWRFTDALSDGDMANMFNYAQTRWGIS